MLIETAFFVVSQFCAALVFTAIALVSVRYRHRALQREIVGTGLERSLSLEGYQRFALARVRILLKVRRINSFTLIGALVGIMAFLPFITATTFVDFGFFQGFHLVVLSLPALLIGVYVAAYIHDIVGTAYVDADALQLAQMSSLHRSDVFTLKMKAILFKLVPLVLYFEVLGGLVLLGYNMFVVLLFLLSCAAIVVIITNVFAMPFYGWANALRPIEQTPWAALASRIEAWSQLAGVRFASIQVQQDLVGTVNVRVVGLGRPTLILSETFLRYTEWRQQDAMVGITLGLVRKHLVRKNFVRSILVFVLAGAFVAALQFLVYSGFNTLLFLPLVIILYVFQFAMRAGSQRFLRTTYFDVDRLAAHLTGDPIAVMVVLNTVNALNGVPAAQPTARVPSTSERMLRLDALIREPWSRAPQSADLVPAATAVSFGPYYLTMPFVQATSAEPVPSAPYASLA